MSADPRTAAVLVAEALVEAVEDGRLDLRDESWLRRTLAAYRAAADPEATP